MIKIVKKGIRKAKKKLPCIGWICWIIIPIAIITLLILDGVGVYTFNTERLIVIGACVMVALIPFFSEITIKNISIKKEHTRNKERSDGKPPH